MVGTKLMPITNDNINREETSRLTLQYLNELSNEIGPRAAGSENEQKAADYIITKFKEFGYNPHIQPFTSEVQDNKIISSSNIEIIKKGISSTEIMIGAHYDSVEVGEGADDNASSIAVMLYIAEKLNNWKTYYTIRLVAFGAEEAGLKGSRFYVSQMRDSEIQKTMLMINMDSLIAGDHMYVYGYGWRTTEIGGQLAKIFNDYRTSIYTEINESVAGDWSDYAPFKRAGIPCLHLEATNWQLGDKDGYTQVDESLGVIGKIWHTKYDTIDYISRTFPGRIENHLLVFSRLLHDIMTKIK